MLNNRAAIEPTPEKDAVIDREVAADPDNQGWEDAGPWHPVSEEFPESAASPPVRVRGKQRAPTKVKLAIRLDANIVDHYRGTGPGWHIRINEALRKAAFGE